MSASKNESYKKKTHPYVFQRRGAGRVKHILLAISSKVNHPSCCKCHTVNLPVPKFDNKTKAAHNHRMNYGEYSWQSPHWPNWQYDLAALAEPLAAVSHAQGLLFGRLADVGMPLRDEASLSALTQDVVQTSAIEGETLNVASVRSSVARRLGVDIGALAPADRHVDGVVDMVLDATSNATASLTTERLFGWHAALFPTGYSGISRIHVGTWRDDSTGAELPVP